MMFLATAVNDRDNILLPAVISIFTFGKAYHSELVFSDGSALVVTPRTFGYQKHDYDWYEWALVPLPMIDEHEEAIIRKKADDILATNPKYDYLGAVFGRFGKCFDLPNRWYCSELSSYLIEDFIPIKKREHCRFISPTHLWKSVAEHVKARYPNSSPSNSSPNIKSFTDSNP